PSFLYPFCHGAAPPRPRPSFPTRRSSDLQLEAARDGDAVDGADDRRLHVREWAPLRAVGLARCPRLLQRPAAGRQLLQVEPGAEDRKSTRLNSSHVKSSYAVFCLKKKIGE